MRFIKYIFILSLCFPTLVLSAGGVDVCSVSFSKHEEFIKSFFSDPKNINQYQGKVGYIRFVEEHLSFLQMDTIFNYTSKILSKEDIGILNWQVYHGSTKEFRQERSNILDETGNVKKKYQGQFGYARYADEFYAEKMQKAYLNVSAVLSESEKKSLNWQQYQGNTKEFRKERLRVLDEIGNVKEEYQGSKGYALYADEFYLGKMQQAYQNVSAVLSESEKKSLNWQSYQGNTKEFIGERSRILDEQGNIKKEYQGQFGYARYADEFYGGERKELGKMQKTYQNVSAVLSESEKKNLNWQQYYGSTKEFRQERLQILDETGNIKKEYQGQFGYVRYSDEFYAGKMQTTYINISAVLSESEKKSLNWQQYQGNTKEFREERSRVLDKTGNVKKEYQGKAGYARYADEFYLGKMQKTHINVSAVLSESEKKSLNWQLYRGNTKVFIGERSRILDETGNIKKEYQGPIGYARYADEFYVGKMLKAYQNVSAVLSKEDMQDLGWKKFTGDTNQFRSLFEFFKHHSFEDYKGPLGQKKIAKMIFKSHLRNTYTNISTLRAYLFSHKDEFKDLRESGWSPTLSW